MKTSILMDELRAAVDRSAPTSSRRAVLDRFRLSLEALEGSLRCEDLPRMTRARTEAFLDFLVSSQAKLGDKMFQTAYLLNVLGEGVVRADFISAPVIDCLQVGIYFFGLDQIERRWSSRAAAYSCVHADHLATYFSRPQLKVLISEGKARVSEGRVFCLTYHYLNALRKAYWLRCRESADALDLALSSDAPALESSVTAGADRASEPAPLDRVHLMLAIFQQLSERQRWIYLAKNRSLLHGEPAAQEVLRGTADAATVALLSELGEPAAADADMGWSEIASRLCINEKTAKREYLRSLHVLLSETAHAVFGERKIPSNYVRRVLEQIRAIVYEKDLRIRSASGKGIGPLVEKWEVALRFVLHHQQVPAA